MPWKHITSLKDGIVTNDSPFLIPDGASTFINGMSIKDGIVSSDYGCIDFPVEGVLKTNELNGSIMKIDQFNTFAGVNYCICLTTTQAYTYNTVTNTWDCITQGVLVDDCETAWTASANVTSTRDTSVKLRGTYSAKHVIASGFTTGIVSYYNISSTDISAVTNTNLSLWIYANATVANDVLRIRLSEQTNGGTGATYADYTVPALTANKWKHITMAIASPVASSAGTFPTDLNAVLSVALIAQSDPGVVTVYLDDIRTTKNFTGNEDNRYSTSSYNNYYVITNGVDLPQKWTGSGVLTTLATALTAGSIATSELVFAFKDHLFLANNTENGADCPQRVSWSNIGKIEDWASGTAGYQDLTDDESWVTAVVQFGENEVIWYKEKSIVKMTWVGGQNPFRFTTMMSNTSIIGKDAVTDIRGEHLVIGNDSVYAYNGEKSIVETDEKLSTSMFTLLNSTYKDRSFIIYDLLNSEVQLWIPTSTSYPDDVWCVNTNTKQWYRRSKSMTGFGVYKQQSSVTIGDLIGVIGDQNYKIGDQLSIADTPITLVGDNNGRVYKLYSGTYDNDGVAITNEFQTKDFALPETGEFLNKFMRVPQMIFEANGLSVTTTYSIDSGVTWSPTSGGGLNITTLNSSYNLYQQDFDVVTRKIRFKFYNNSLSSNFNLRYFGFYYIIRSGRR